MHRVSCESRRLSVPAGLRPHDSGRTGDGPVARATLV